MAFKLRAGKCSICEVWFILADLALLWQDSPGVFRGVCVYCNGDLEDQAKDLDWEDYVNNGA